MQIFVNTPDEYLKAIPTERFKAVSTLRNTLLGNLPKGFEETINYGMLAYVVPHRLYPAGYHCTPALPLPFISIASQKNYIALYHMGIYAYPDLLNWFKEAYPKHANHKLDMGKGCIRFKKMDDIPYGLIAELAQKITPEEWINIYETTLKPNK